MKTLLIIAAGYILMCAFLYFYQHKLIYFPSHKPFEDCRLTARDYQGVRFYLNDVSEKAVVVYHGNAGRACDRSFLAYEFAELGYSTIIVEYPGYAGDNEKPSMQAILRDVEKMDSFLRESRYSELVVFGESIGTGPASYHASIGSPGQVILLAPFRELALAVPWAYRIFPVRLLLKDNYKNKEWLSGFKGSVLIIHGRHDNIVPARLSEGIYEGSERVLVNSGHNDMYNKETWDRIRQFMSLP